MAISAESVAPVVVVFGIDVAANSSVSSSAIRASAATSSSPPAAVDAVVVVDVAGAVSASFTLSLPVHDATSAAHSNAKNLNL